MFRRLTRTTALSADLGLLLVRVGFGFTLALAHGSGKVGNLQGFVETVTRRGIPLPGLLGPLAAFSECFGGLLLGFGLATRPAAAAVLATMLVAAFDVHAGDPFSRKELALAYALAALAILVAGPGRFSVDARWIGKRR